MSTYRPVGIRIAAAAAGTGLAVIGVVVAVVLPASVRTTFTPEQVVTIVLAALGMVAVLHGLGRSSVRTDDAGVVVVNGYRTHRVAWEQIDSIGLGRGAPWAVLERTDGDPVMVMAVQNADGARARVALATLRDELAAHR